MCVNDRGSAKGVVSDAGKVRYFSTNKIVTIEDCGRLNRKSNRFHRESEAPSEPCLE